MLPTKPLTCKAGVGAPFPCGSAPHAGGVSERERGRDFGLWRKLQAMCCHMFRKQVYDDLVHMITVCGMQSHFLTKVKGSEGLEGVQAW